MKSRRAFAPRVTDAAYFAVLADRELSRVAADGLKRAQEASASRARASWRATRSPLIRLSSTPGDRARIAVLAQRLCPRSRGCSRAADRLLAGGSRDGQHADSRYAIHRSRSDRRAARAGPDVEGGRAAEVARMRVIAERGELSADIIIGATAGGTRESFPQRSSAVSSRSRVASVWDGGHESSPWRARARSAIQLLHIARIASEGPPR